MKKMLSLLFLITLPYSGIVEAAKPYSSFQFNNLNHFAFYAPQLSQAIKAILQVPECAQLIEEVQKEGLVGIKWEPMGNRGDAVWYGDKRIIVLNSEKKRAEGQKICSILFEMHNALNNRRFLQLDQLAIEGKIDKESYVESIERIEHQNALNTKRLIEKGIAMGAFPQDTRWSIIHQFDDHYKVQQLMGHSYQISHAYDTLNPHYSHIPYIGTISNLHQITDFDKKRMLNYLSVKDTLENGSEKEKEQSRRLLHQMLQEVRYKPHSHYDQNNYQLAILCDIFKGNPIFERLQNSQNYHFPN